VFLAQTLRLFAPDVRVLILKVQQYPKLEAGIGNRHFYPVVPSLLLGVRKSLVFVYVTNAPHFVISQVVVSAFLGCLPCVLFRFDGSFDDPLGISPRMVDLQWDIPLALDAAEIARLRDRSLADDQKTAIR
jgi:hypothetical protein